MNRLPLSPGAWLLMAATGLTMLVFLLPPIAQPPAYHDFADQRACPGLPTLLPNCLDTASNILFILAGLLPLLVAAGLASVAWWLWSETQGQGDLRPYLLMQAAPMLLIPLLLWRAPPRYSRTGDILAVIGLYALALLLDYGDRAVFSASGGVVSGHTLKHAVAALAAYGVARHLRLRRAT